MTHDWDALRRVAAAERSPAAIGPFVPWQCEYRGDDGGIYSIVLRGTDPEQVWQANMSKLPGLRILGVHWEQIDGGNQ